MSEDLKSFSQAVEQLHFALGIECITASEAKQIKHDFQKLYKVFADRYDGRKFLNWGLWDNKIYNEYRALNFNFSTLCPSQDIYSQLLLYSVIKPLIKSQFFNKRLLDVGCGNGIGLKLSSELLATRYAVGVDLVNKLASNANTHFYKENKIHFIQSDAENLAIDNESVDIVTNLESSHLYPNIEHFFSEMERVLSPGGFFCYADIHFNHKQQAKKLENFIKTRKNLKIIQKNNITKMVQSSIYQRLITHEDAFYREANALFGNDQAVFLTEFPYLVGVKGLAFLPWWKIKLKNEVLEPMVQYARKTNWCWGKKYYFYYLIQKVD